MQTFLAYADYDEAARVLDPKRLGNQFYREGLTLLRGGWSNHPASRMWLDCGGVDYRWSLCEYLRACSRELARRGFSYPHHDAEIAEAQALYIQRTPPWLGEEWMHASHRAALLFKAPEWYGQFGWAEAPDVPVDGSHNYFWPTMEGY